MQTLAGCGQLAFLRCFAPPGLLIAFALLPLELLLARFLDTTLFVIGARVGCSPLSMHFPLQATKLLLIGNQLLTEDRQALASLALLFHCWLCAGPGGRI